MASHSHATHDAHEGFPWNYLWTLAGLLLLTFFTVFVARHPFESNTINVVIALTVATVKASLVALIFMHLWHDSKVNAIILCAAFVFLFLMLLTNLTDYVTRLSTEPANHNPTPVQFQPFQGKPGATQGEHGQPGAGHGGTPPAH